MEENRFMEVSLLSIGLDHDLVNNPIEPFEDEVHPRLRFSHRGLVGMANNGQKNSNDSQFFITLGMPTEALYYT